MTCEAAKERVDKAALSLLQTSLQAHKFAREYLDETDRVTPRLTADELEAWRIYAVEAEDAARRHREALDQLRAEFVLHGRELQPQR